MRVIKKISWNRNYGMGLIEEFTEYNTYFLQSDTENKYYEYNTYPKKEWEKIIKSGEKEKPTAIILTNESPEEMAEHDNSSAYFRDSQKIEYVELKGMSAQNCLSFLEIPKDYINGEINVITKQSPEITEEMKKKIDNEFKEVIAIYGEDYSQILEENCEDSKVLKVFCARCGTQFKITSRIGYTSVECPDCANRTGYYSDRHLIVDSKFKKHRTENFNGSGYRDIFYNQATKATDRFLLLQAIPNGIRIYRMKRDFSLTNGKLTKNYAIEYSVTHVIGGEMSSYKHLKNEKRPCDSFTALNINTKTLRFSQNIIYYDAEDFFDFAEKNEEVLNMSGFIDTLKYSTENIDYLDAFFILYIAILNKYPILEQIIKMGHSKLFFDLFEDLMASQNKEELSGRIEILGQLVNTETTKGKNSLRIPSYIGDYLIKKSAHLTEYYYWRDVYEITNISKDNFEKLINSFNFAYINSQIGFQDIGNILKYGYDPIKLNSYLIKQLKKLRNNYCDLNRIVNFLSDYLQTCELMDVEPDMFPMDLIKQHNDISEAYRRLEANKYDERLSRIGNACEKYFNNLDEKAVGIPKLMEEYCVVFPKSETDFMNEGNMQHNCVGSYPSRVRNGQCIIFFLRKKDKPNYSYITGECTKSGLRQFYLSNNRYVTDEDVISLGKYICNIIKRGCSSGNIPGLGNVSK